MFILFFTFGSLCTRTFDFARTIHASLPLSHEPELKPTPLSFIRTSNWGLRQRHVLKIETVDITLTLSPVIGDFVSSTALPPLKTKFGDFDTSTYVTRKTSVIFSQLETYFLQGPCPVLFMTSYFQLYECDLLPSGTKRKVWIFSFIISADTIQLKNS